MEYHSILIKRIFHRINISGIEKYYVNLEKILNFSNFRSKNG
jgi:hypothetical protein